MGQRWRTFDLKWYEMEVMTKMTVDYVILEVATLKRIFVKKKKQFDMHLLSNQDFC